MEVRGFICGPRLYDFEGWIFKFHASSGPWPLKKDGELRKRAGDKFYSMFERFDKLSDETRKSKSIASVAAGGEVSGKPA